jgi:serine phosphatase RsbU (regulator of sigma subunit)
LPNGKVESLKQVGYPLGAARKRKVKFDELQLPAKCRLVMFSDGFVEAMNPEGEFFGYERLESAVSNLAMGQSPKDFIREIQNQVRKYSMGVPWGDDVTMVVVDYDAAKRFD